MAYYIVSNPSPPNPNITHASNQHNTQTKLLAKVHERQTARMKTRSEWFLADEPHHLLVTDTANPMTGAGQRMPNMLMMSETALGFHVAEYRSFDDINQYRNAPYICSLFFLLFSLSFSLTHSHYSPLFTNKMLCLCSCYLFVFFCHGCCCSLLFLFCIKYVDFAVFLIHSGGSKVLVLLFLLRLVMASLLLFRFTEFISSFVQLGHFCGHSTCTYIYLWHVYALNVVVLSRGSCSFLIICLFFKPFFHFSKYLETSGHKTQ